MIDLAGRSLAEIDDRLARIESERASLLVLRDAWHRYLELDDSSIEQPEGGGVPPVVEPPAGDSPGSARSGQGQRRRNGRRAPAAAAAPSTSSSGSVGTPTPASLPPIRATGQQEAAQQRVARQRAAGPYVCGDCGRDNFPLPQNVMRHRSSAHPGSSTPPTPKPRWHPEPVGIGADNVEIKNGKERWLCNRCPLGFPDREARDLHQETHPPIPDAGDPVGSNPLTRHRLPAGVPIA
jgi:hypothetical protein